MATLKTEGFDQMLPTHAEAQRMGFEYWEAFYNPKRLPSALGYRSPVEFENQLKLNHHPSLSPQETLI